MDSTTIQLSRTTRDHLAELARDRGISIGQLVEVLAAREPTAAQRAQQLAADREVVRRLVGLDISDEEFEQAPDILGNIYRVASDKARAARGDVA